MMGSLGRIAKGTGIIIFGQFLGMGLGFITRIVIARTITQTEYGIFSLGLMLVNIFATISVIGLNQGVPRQLAYYKSHSEKIKEIVGSSVLIGIFFGFFSFLLLFFTSEVISTRLFDNPTLIEPLRVFSVGIPFLVVVNILTSVFRGFERPVVNVYFSALRSVTFLSLVVIIFILQLSLRDIIYAFVFSTVFTCLVISFYSAKIPIKISLDIKSTVKEMIYFSVPLLGVISIGLIMSWTDIFMLGYFKNSDAVGLYESARPLARFIFILFGSVGFMYNPVASQLFSENRINELKRNYQIITKWMFSITLPIFFIMFLFPSVVLEYTFGLNYVPAANALRILVLGFMFHAFLGVNGLTMVVMGENRLLFSLNLFNAASNIILNIILIPQFGVTGAALATASSYIMANTLISSYLYRLSGIHPFTKNYLKPLIFSTVIILLIFIISFFLKLTLWLVFISLIAYIVAYFLFLLLSRSFDKEDIDLLLAVERRAGLNLSVLKKILKRFV